MSQAKEFKQREWTANIFSGTQSNTPSNNQENCRMFDRKKKNETPKLQSDHISTLNSSFGFRRGESPQCSFVKKSDEGDLFLYRSNDNLGSRSGCNTPAGQRMKESISMAKILQPYMALDLIHQTNEGGFQVTKDSITLTGGSKSQIRSKNSNENKVVLKDRKINGITTIKEEKSGDGKVKSRNGGIDAKGNRTIDIITGGVRNIYKENNAYQSISPFKPILEKNGSNKQIMRKNVGDQYYLKGIGENHQRSVDQALNKSCSNVNNCSNITSQRSKISTAHDWKTEVNKVMQYKEDWDPKNVSQQQLRSELESDDLIRTIRHNQNLLAKSFVSNKEERNKLPTYMESHTLPQKLDESKVQVINLELKSLPQQIDEKEIKSYFSNSHVISVEAEKDNLTGLCNGKGKVQIRCTDSSQFDKLSQTLSKNGVKFEIKSQKGPLEYKADLNKFNINTRSIEEFKKNEWLESLKKDETRDNKDHQQSRQSVGRDSVMYRSSVNKSYTSCNNVNSTQKCLYTIPENNATLSKSNLNDHQPHLTQAYQEYMEEVNPTVTASQHKTQEGSKTSSKVSIYLDRNFKKLHNDCNLAQPPYQQVLSKTPIKQLKNKENIVSSKNELIKSKSQLQIPKNVKQSQCQHHEQVDISRSFTSQSKHHEKPIKPSGVIIRGNETVNKTIMADNKTSQPKCATNIQPLNPNSSLLKPTKSSRGKRNFH